MLFKIPQNIIVSLIFILLGGLLVWLSIIELGMTQFEGNYSLLGIWGIKNSYLLNLVCVILLFTCSYVVYRINQRQRFVEGKSLPFILYSSLGLSACIVTNISIVDTFAVFLSLISLSIILQIHNQKSVLGLLFMSSLVLGSATVFFYPSLLLFLIPVFTIAFFRPFEVRNYAVIVVGISLIGFYLFCSAFLFDLEVGFSNIEFSSIKSMISFNSALIPLVLFSIFALIGALKTFINRAKFVVRQRNQLLAISVYIVIQLVLFLILGNAVFWISIVPVLSIFISYYYKTSARKWLLDIVTLLFIVGLVWLKF
ncbi:MAG: hypothetical protein ACJAV5_001445 [Vicingaceae bacterium]